MTGQQIDLTVDVVVRDPDRVLLIRRRWDPYSGWLALPGGYVEPGEAPVAAAARELREETGLRVAPGKLQLVGVYGHPGRDPRGHVVSIAYLARVSVDDLNSAAAGDDAADVAVVPVDQLATAQLAFDHADILRDAEVVYEREGRDHHDIDQFPESLRVREYPQQVSS